MPITKHSLARYQVIDACIRNRQRSYPGIDYLIERCSQRLDQQISRSTIEKDLKAMKDDPDLGYYAPIRYDRQSQGYYYENPGYSITNIQVHEEDIDAIEFAARILLQYRGFHMVKRYAEAIDRILDVVDVRRILSIEEFAEYVQFENPPYIEGTSYIDPVIRAIKEKRVIEITHEAFTNEDKVQGDERKVINAKSEIRYLHPYLLKEYRNRWYVVGLDEEKNEIRTFGLDRIKSLSLSPAHLPQAEGSYGLHPIAFRKVEFDPKTYFQHTIGIIAPQSKPPKIKIEFTKRQAQYLITQPIHASQKVLKETKDKVVFGFEVHPTYEFISMILGYGYNARVVSPNWLKFKVMDIIEGILDKYNIKGKSKTNLPNRK
jgi:predicted DNA-binding transcriptional regulator YafY